MAILTFQTNDLSISVVFCTSTQPPDSSGQTYVIVVPKLQCPHPHQNAKSAISYLFSLDRILQKKLFLVVNNTVRTDSRRAKKNMFSGLGGVVWT